MNAEMFNPPHPGEILQEWIEGLNTNVTHFASHIGVSRVTLSRILNGRGSITAEMALRLSAALGDRPGIWLDLQAQYDLWQAKQKKIPPIAKFPRAA
ncbi:HigA family addiction module antitoxin [Telmatobacter bradus]|uniref:HigA family addiction module antitoxin n=1 Tax=Telmatobacter bradus TaxID=474953 RepID=UPI003B434540